MAINQRISITLDKPRKLLFNLNAMVSFEEATGKSILKGEIDQEMTAVELRALLWGCLLDDDPSLTIEAVGKMIDSNNMNEIAAQLIKAWNVAVPEGKPSPSP
jgi:hypothetical protein